MSGGVRRDLIDKKIVMIMDNLDVVKSGFPRTFDEFGKMGLARDGVYKRIEASIELVLDICNVLNCDLNLGIPEEEGNSIDNLERAGRLSGEVADLVRRMRGFRNVLVHRYGEVDDERAFEMIRDGMGDFLSIVREFER